jgi:hypothetical protein
MSPVRCQNSIAVQLSEPNSGCTPLGCFDRVTRVAAAYPHKTPHNKRPERAFGMAKATSAAPEFKHMRCAVCLWTKDQLAVLLICKSARLRTRQAFGFTGDAPSSRLWASLTLQTLAIEVVGELPNL